MYIGIKWVILTCSLTAGGRQKFQVCHGGRNVFALLPVWSSSLKSDGLNSELQCCLFPITPAASPPDLCRRIPPLPWISPLPPPLALPPFTSPPLAIAATPFFPWISTAGEVLPSSPEASRSVRASSSPSLPLGLTIKL